MLQESVRYFNGQRFIEYSSDTKDVDYISYEVGQPVSVAFKHNTVLKIQSPFIEYKSKWIQDDSDERDRFGW